MPIKEEILIEDGNWRVIQSNSIIIPTHIYRVEHINGFRLYIYDVENVLNYRRVEYRTNRFRLLERYDIPESIKDFIRTLEVMDNL